MLGLRQPTEMKYRLGASISSLIAGAGGGGGSRICKALSFNPKFDLFHDKFQINRNLLRGFASLRRSTFSFVHEEDEFSELGPSVAEGRGKLPKLLTEKPDYYLNKKAPAGRSSYGSHARMTNILQPLSSETPALRPKPEMIDILGLSSNSESALVSPPKSEKIDIPRLSSNSDCAPATCPEPEKNDIHALLTDGEYAYNLNKSNSISIENVPTAVELFQLMQALSKFGKISSACMRTLPDGLRCCDVEFENSSSSHSAVTGGSISIKGNKMRIRPLHVQETFVTIRINGISKETTDSSIHALCKSIGPLEGIVKTGQDVNAIFSLKNDPDIQGILSKLNSTSLNNCQWSACLLPRNSPPTVKLRHDDGKRKLGSEIYKCLSDVKVKHLLKRLHIEDLQYLHSLITHLEGEHAVVSSRV